MDVALNDFRNNGLFRARFEHFVGHASIGFGVRLNHDALTPAELAGDEIIIPVDAPGARLKIVFDSMSRVSGTGV